MARRPSKGAAISAVPEMNVAEWQLAAVIKGCFAYWMGEKEDGEGEQAFLDRFRPQVEDGVLLTRSPRLRTHEMPWYEFGFELGARLRSVGNGEIYVASDDLGDLILQGLSEGMVSGAIDAVDDALESVFSAITDALDI